MDSKRVLLAVLMALLLSACDNHAANADQAPSRTLAEIKESGRLVVATRNAPTTYYIDRRGEPAGPEHDLVTAFAESLGVEVEFVKRPSVGAVLDAVENAEADLAATGLTITESRRDRFRFGPAYQPVTQQVVCRRDRGQPEKVADLVGLDLRVIADSSYRERLQVLRTEYPALEWQEVEDTPPRPCCAACGSGNSTASRLIRPSSISIGAITPR